MKNTKMFASITLGFAAAFAVNASADLKGLGGKLVEIPVDGFISPSQGFDNNDNVEGIVYGYLPNNCYSLSKSKVVHSATSQDKFIVKQFAIKKLDGVCGEGNREGAGLSDSLKMRVPFFSEASVGPLPKGEYTIEYQRTNGNGVRSVEIAESEVSTIDSFPYANISNAMTTEITSAKDDITVTLSGVYNSSCTTLDRVDVKKVSDVFIVLPILKTKGGMCTEALIPFKKTINLGKAELGMNLIHIRSMSGKAINRLVHVFN